MHPNRRNFLSPFLATLCLLLAARAAVAGDTVKYPEKAPILSFTLPAGWEHFQQDTAIQPFIAEPSNDEATNLTLMLFKGDSDEANIMIVFPVMSQGMAKDFKMTDPQAGQAMQETLGGGIHSVGCIVTGKIAGKPATLLFRWFKIGGQAVIMIQMSPDFLKNNQAFGSITASFKPLR